jgi:recombination protein RecT
MANSNVVALRGYFNNETCMNNLRSMLGQKAQGFVTSVLSVVNNNTLLQKASPQSVYSSAMVAASLDLPINPNLGFAAIVPYGQVAQFQIMTRGLIQLAIRSGQYLRITNAVVHEGELVKYNPFTDDYEFDPTKRTSDKVIGYMAYFRMVDGYEKYFYMTEAEVLAHGKKYSKSFNSGPWKDNTEAMCLKTVMKLLLSKFGILSIEMQRAIKYDQGIAKGDFTQMGSVEEIDNAEVEYVDNPEENNKPVEESADNKKERMRKEKKEKPEMP